MNFTVKVTSRILHTGTCHEIELDGVKYARQNQSDTGEVLTISEVRPIYTMRAADDSEQTSLLLAFGEMPRTRFRPGMRVRVIVESL